MKEGMKLKGDVIIETRKIDGTVVEHEELTNLIMDVGKETVTKLIGGLSSTSFKYIGIGTGTTPPAVGDVALESEVKRITPDGGGVYEANFKMVYEKTIIFGSGESYNITEAGLFNSLTVSGSTIFDRFTFNAKPVDSLNNLYIKITITVS